MSKGWKWVLLARFMGKFGWLRLWDRFVKIDSSLSRVGCCCIVWE